MSVLGSELVEGLNESGASTGSAGISLSWVGVGALSLSGGPSSGLPARRQLGGIRGFRLVLGEQLVEQVLVQAGGVERVAAATVRQGEAGRRADVGGADHRRRPDQAAWAAAARAVTISARMPSTSKAAQTRGDGDQLVVAELRPTAAGSRAVTIRCRSWPLGGGVRPGERASGSWSKAIRRRITSARSRRVARGGDLHGEAEPVQQLGAELALLGVHGADQHQLRGVADRDAFALDGRPAGGGGVQQQIDQMIMEQIDFVDVEDAAVRGGQQPRLVAAPGPSPAPALGPVRR